MKLCGKVFTSVYNLSLRSRGMWNCTEATPVPCFCILLQISEDPVTKIVLIMVGWAGFKVHVVWTIIFMDKAYFICTVIILVKHGSGSLLFTRMVKMIRVFPHAASHFGYDCDLVKDPIVLPSELHTVVYSLLFMYTINLQKLHWYKLLQISSVFQICTLCIIVTIFIDSIG